MEHWLTRAAAKHPERVAIVASGQSLTYADLLARARSQAAAFATGGVRGGDRVVIETGEATRFAIGLHACLLLGAAAVPIDARLGQEERRARALSGRAEADGVVTVMYTSGTTAEPKPVELTSRNWRANALGSATALGLDPDERWLCPLPLAHVGGLSILVRSAIYGTTAVVYERFETDTVLAALSDPEKRITLVSLVPTMLSRLLDAGLRKPPKLRWALLGGGPIAPQLLERAHQAEVPVAPTYGMTEACSQIATHGWPLDGVEIKLASDGEVLVRGDVVATGALAGDGWLHTGDLGELSDAGRLTITGRKADTIVSGGENVAPAEVEAVLLAHPAVVEAAVFGRPDPEWGEGVVARVVTRSKISAQALDAFCREDLASFKVPKRFEFAAALPRTESGKLSRRELR